METGSSTGDVPGYPWTPDLYRRNFEVNNPKSFPGLASAPEKLQVVV
jgi:hypothetical protein